MNKATENETTGAVAGQVQRVVMRNPPKLGVVTLCRLMDDCLPEQIDDERDMQQLIDKLWPALCCEFAGDATDACDKQRLDWLADPGNAIGNVQLPTACVESNLDSLRGAIDMAMRMDKAHNA